MKIYALYDNVAEDYIEELILAKNEKMAVRGTLMNVVKNFNLNDIELQEIGEWNKKEKTLLTLQPKKIAWTEYKFPETKAEALAPLELSQKFNEKMLTEKLEKE